MSERLKQHSGLCVKETNRSPSLMLETETICDICGKVKEGLSYDEKLKWEKIGKTDLCQDCFSHGILKGIYGRYDEHAKTTA